MRRALTYVPIASAFLIFIVIHPPQLHLYYSTTSFSFVYHPVLRVRIKLLAISVIIGFCCFRCVVSARNIKRRFGSIFRGRRVSLIFH